MRITEIITENTQGVAEGKIKLSTDPNWYGAEVGDYKASGPIVNIPANRLVGFEPDDKMNQPASKANVQKIVAGLKQGAKLPPLLVRQYENGYQVLDGHHRFWAYKLLGVKSIPAQVVPAEDIEEITKQGVAEAVDPGRRGFLAGLAGFAAVSAMPPGLVSALSTPEGIQGMSVSDVSALLKAIRAYLPPYDQEDWTGTFERWEKMADALRIPDDDLDAADKLDRLLRQYRRDPEAASAKLLRHLQRHAVDLTDVRGQTIDQWNDVATVSKADPVNDEIRQMQQQIADYNAQQRREKTPGIGQAQTAATAVTAFRDLVQRVIDASTAAVSAPPREKYMGRIEPTSSAPALPAPDRSAAEIMKDLQNIVDRPLSDEEKQVVKQELKKYSEHDVSENFADGRVKGRSRPGRVKRSGASCKGSVTDLRAKARKYGGERGKMYHWCANMKAGKKK